MNPPHLSSIRFLLFLLFRGRLFGFVRLIILWFFWFLHLIYLLFLILLILLSFTGLVGLDNETEASRIYILKLQGTQLRHGRDKEMSKKIASGSV